MNTCTKKIVYPFGALLFAAIVLFVPIRQITVRSLSGSGGIGTRTTVIGTGFSTLPGFMKMSGERILKQTGAKVTTTLRATLYAYIIGAVVVLGVCDYVLFCGRFRRRKTALGPPAG